MTCLLADRIANRGRIRVFTALFAFCLALPVAAQLDIGGQVVDLVSQSADLVYSIEDLGGRVDSLALSETETEIRIELAADVLFTFDSADIQPEAAAALAEAAAVIGERSRGAVRIEGHTDGKGGEAYNLALSQRRAASVRDWFVQKGGLSQMDFIVAGLGESQPVASETNPDGSDDPQGRQRNRRVEIRLQK